MSVIKSKRTESKLQVLTKAREMCVYTLTICKNEKHFPKRNRWILTQPIVNEAIAVLACIRRANAVRVERYEDFIYRNQQQTEAYSRCEALLSLIELAFLILEVESDRIEYWTGLIVTLEGLIQRWVRSDLDRYKEYSGDTIDNNHSSLPIAE